MSRRYRPMPPLTHRAERALRECIKEKWEPASKADALDLALLQSRHTCALCDLYWDDDCVDCPISQRSGRAYCHGTPFDSISVGSAIEDFVREVVKRELRFLRDTLRLGLAAREREKRKKE